MALTGSQYQELTSALMSAFPSAIDLSMMVRFKLDLNLDTIVSPALPLSAVTFELVQAMEARGWTARLVAAARESRPGNPSLFAAAQKLGVAASPPPQAKTLERVVRESNSFLDIVKVRTRLAEIEARV